jgi:uncharacterized membrane protein
MYYGEAGDRRSFRWISRRNSSLSATARILVFASLAVVTLAISLGFAIRGAWPVVPFAGLECVALWLAYRWLKRHEADYELITVDPERVVVEVCNGGVRHSHEFARAWAQVVLEATQDGRPVVWLRSHGREVQVGKWMTDEARLSAARQLKRQISGKALNRDQEHLGEA